jgi:tRNA pseudouridine38-40 synthase
LTFLIIGDGFLRGMVRALVGTLLQLGASRLSLADFEGLLAGGSRSEAGPNAKAHGLVLQRVYYEEDGSRDW